MFAVMRLVQHLELDTGQRVNLSGMQGCKGMIPVFDSKESAEEIYGVGVELMPVGTEDGYEKNHTTATPPKGEDDHEQ